jgi:hypothetical protein
MRSKSQGCYKRHRPSVRLDHATTLTLCEQNNMYNPNDTTSNEATPISKEKQAALDALASFPSTVMHFIMLCDLLLLEPYPSSIQLDRTFKFIRENKLPKAKMMDWLKSLGISTDLDFLDRICDPIAEKFTIIRRSGRRSP